MSSDTDNTLKNFTPFKFFASITVAFVVGFLLASYVARKNPTVIQDLTSQQPAEEAEQYLEQPVQQLAYTAVNQYLAKPPRTVTVVCSNESAYPGQVVLSGQPTKCDDPIFTFDNAVLHPSLSKVKILGYDVYWLTNLTEIKLSFSTGKSTVDPLTFVNDQSFRPKEYGNLQPGRYYFIVNPQTNSSSLYLKYGGTLVSENEVSVPPTPLFIYDYQP